MAHAESGPKTLPTLVQEAMLAIEKRFEPLRGVLPKDYGIFEPKVLEDLMRVFDSEQIRQATGDVFGRIYEYFLAEFSIQKAHDNGVRRDPAGAGEVRGDAGGRPAGQAGERLRRALLHPVAVR